MNKDKEGREIVVKPKSDGWGNDYIQIGTAPAFGLGEQCFVCGNEAYCRIGLRNGMDAVLIRLCEGCMRVLREVIGKSLEENK